MPSASSHASWNPAFMPNTTADTIATKSFESELSSPSTAPEHILEAAKPEPDAPISHLNGGGIVPEVKEPELENTAEPELRNIDDAPSTSFADQVEASNRDHHGIADEEPTVEHEEVVPCESPSKGKHLSTMSFARTVSDDVNWGEDDEVDPQWNLQPVETGPFESMPPTNRTNSFPQVPPREIHQQLPHSQAEQIMNEVEQDSRDLFATEGEDPEADFFNKTSAPRESQNDLSLEAQQDTSDWFPDYGQAYGDHPREEDAQEEEARFEEGLPLVQHEESQNPHQEQATDLGFMDEERNAEEDFFARAGKSEVTEEAAPNPHLDRKSTMQVLDSLNFEPHRQAQDIIAEEESSQSPLERATGGGFRASRSTVFSATLGDPDAPIHGQPKNLANLGMDSGDGDLAAKWKAALAGDEFLDDDDDELLPDDDEPAEAPAETLALDPAVLFADDDEGFLEDDDQDFLAQQGSPAAVANSNGHVKAFESNTAPAQSARPGSSGNRYLPAGALTAAPLPANNYAPSAPLFTDLSKPTSAPGVSSYSSPAIGSFQPPARPDMQPKAQSFANMSKGGYHSPYDLPMEVVKPRKRVSMQPLKHSQGIAPPRSASMFNQAAPPSGPPPAMPTPPTNSQGFQPSQLQQQPPQAGPPKVVRKSQSGFFEDLPMASRPRPAPRHSGAFPSPAPSPYAPPNAAPPPAGPVHSYSVPSVQQHPVQPPQSFPFPQPNQGLVAPERVSPYASLPTGAPPVTAAVTSRYSPAPPPLSHSHTAPPPVSQSRYSPAPPNAPRQQASSYTAPPVSQPPAAPPMLPHQPRTSSPLAHFERNQNQPSSHPANFDRRSSSSGYESTLRASHLPPTREADEYEPLQSPSMNKSYGELQSQSPPQPLSQPPPAMRHTPPPPQGLASRLVNSPPKRPMGNYQPQQAANGAPPQFAPSQFAPPQRSQTQSPGSMYASAPKSEPYRRPASTEAHPPPRPSVVAYPQVTPPQGRARGFSQVDYVAPTDGREHDPLQRWKGAPVFAWGVGGTIMTSFPTDVPRYGIHSNVPQIIRSPGQVKIRSIKDVEPLQQRLASFPGPLKGKARKKDVVTWLSAGIELLEQGAAYLRSFSVLSHEDKRVEERILLWKILRVFIEQDGILEGSAIVDKAVRAVLSPGIDDENPAAAPLYATGAELSGISHSSTTATRADPVDPAAVDELRRHLLRGDREKAVWDAVDKRLWAHAMLISNTVSKDLYKQVAQEFVQKEVKIIGENTQSLAALYEIFAGNFEESIDELVPPSARAGFQMVSTSNTAGPTSDALNGLDRWRETLGLVLSNRSTDDSQALTALGKLLSGYGRAEAAHICFLFARSTSVFGGIDDPATSIVLVGSDQLRQPFDFDRELEPVLLSEVFEYGMSLANPTAIALSSPHLAVYKLQHAKILAEYGFRDKALLYCEAIATSITSQTRRSPYHHPLLVAELDDLSKRLKSSPKDESGSWISKPSIDKAKGSVWATFNKFVAGDESDASGPGSTGSANDVGPFARIAGGTPTISRSPSNTELYGSYNDGQHLNGGAGPMQIATKATSRYAPGAAFTPGGHEPQSASSYGSQPRRSMEERSSSEFNRYEPQRQMSQMSDNYRPTSQPNNGSTPNNYTPQTNTPQSSYTPFGNTGSPYEPAYTPQTPITDQAPNMFSSPQPLTNLDGQQPYVSAQPSYTRESSNSYAPPTSNSFDQSSTSYEPPSYEPATMGEEPDSPIDTISKKKFFMDDDDDDIPALKTAPASGEKTKAEKDREADEAFRRAAEADAQKSKEAAPAKKGWGLGGWFGGGAKKEADMSAPAGNKPIRAKLGEASSFVYDPELKRWVNKKAGSEQTEVKSATPPPPRGSSVPPSDSRAPLGGGLGPTSAPRAGGTRAVSEGMASTPPSGMDGEVVGLGLAPLAMARSASNGSGPSTGPPSRPGTSMSIASVSSIDDLLGPPTAGGSRKKGDKKKRGRGYVDVMGGEK